MAISLTNAYAFEEDKPSLIEQVSSLAARASSTSEVLTLNLTNLLILLVLKALIFGFGLFSFGTGNAGSSYSSYSRSTKETGITETDVTGGLCFMQFTSGDLDKMSCVQRAACEDPKTATDYLTAGKMWHKLNKLMRVVPFNREYYDIMTSVQEAVDHSLAGGACNKYSWA